MTAKKSLLLMLLPVAATLLSGCSSDVVVEEASSDVLITYQVSADHVETRGEAISNSSFPKAGRKFKLWCWMTDDNGATYRAMTSDFNTNPLTDIDVTYTAGTGWTTSETFYWPRPRYRADFYAIYPPETSSNPSGVATSFTATTKTITYTSFDGNTDLMYATYSDQRAEKDVREKHRSATLNFYHATTQVMFFGKLSSQLNNFGWEVEVKDITIYNVKADGTFTFQPYDAAKVTKPEAMTFALKEGASTRVYSPTMNYPESEATQEIKKIKIDATSMADNHEVQLTSSSDALMLLPQDLKPWDSDNEKSGTVSPTTSGGYLAINLRAVQHQTGEQPDIYPLKADGGFVTVYVPFGSTTDGATIASSTVQSPWLAGKLYKYILTFGVGLSAGGKTVIQPIKIEAAIAPWLEATPVTATIKH